MNSKLQSSDASRLVLFVTLGMLALFVWGISLDGQTLNSYVPNQLLVGFENEALPLQIQIVQGRVQTNLNWLNQISQNYDLKGMTRIFRSNRPRLLGHYVLTFKNDINVSSMKNLFESHEEVTYASPNYIATPAVSPNDAYYDLQQNLQIVLAESAWEVKTGDSTVFIGVSDTGIDTAHVDIIESLWRNWDEINGTPEIDDDDNGVVDDFYGAHFYWSDSVIQADNNLDGGGHGMHVSGIAAARTNNSGGIAGMAGGWSPDTSSCRIITAKYSDGTEAALARGIEYLIDEEAQVINMSWGFEEDPYGHQELRAIIFVADEEDIVQIAAAHNWNTETKYYPASDSLVMAVANTNNLDGKFFDSNYGTWVDISAPGANVYSTENNQNYGYQTGTSMSAPLLSGLAGLIRARWPDSSNTFVRKQLMASADDINLLNVQYGGKLGSGRANADSVLRNYVAGDPCMIFNSHDIYDPAPLGNDDGLLTPGEACSLIVWMKDVADDVSNVSCSLYTNTPNVTVNTTSPVDYGNFNFLTSIRDTFKISVGAAYNPASGPITFDMWIEGDDNYQITRQFGVEVEFGETLSSFGLDDEVTITTHGILFDVDNDNADEIVFGADDGYVYGYNANGTCAKSYNTGITSNIIGAPAIGDLDHDGDYEVVAIINNGSNCRICAWDMHSQSEHQGYPVNLSTQNFNEGVSPVLADVDNDCNVDIAVGTDASSNNLRAYKYDGTLIYDWTVADEVICTPTIDDVDGDNIPEIFVFAKDEYGTIKLNSMVYNREPPLWTDNPGSIGPYYPVSCKLGDIDLDGNIEVVTLFEDQSLQEVTIAVRFFDANNNQVDRNESGALATGGLSGKMELLISDVNSDEDYPEIIVKISTSNFEHIIMIDYALNYLADYKKVIVSQNNSKSNICVGDINDDDQNEVLFASSNGLIYALAENLQPLSGFPISAGREVVLNSLMTGDLNGNGDVDIWALSDEDSVYYYDLGMDYDFNTVQSSMYRYDPRNTGAFYRNISENPSTSEIWKGFLSLTKDITIPSGLTVTIEPSSRVRAAKKGVKLEAKGGLSAEGEADDYITFFPNEVEWDGIWADSVLAAQPVVLRNCVIRDGRYGVHANDIDDPDYLTIDSSYISYCDVGIYLVDSDPSITYDTLNYNGHGIVMKSSFPVIENNSVIYNDTVGLYFLNQSSPRYIDHNEISNNESHGVYCTNSSDPEFNYVQSYGGGYNLVESNEKDGFHARGDSYPVLGTTTNHGNNSINAQGDNYKRVNNNNGGETPILAVYNYWFGTPQASYFNGNVTYFPYLSSQPSDGFNLGKGPNQTIAGDSLNDPNYCNLLGTELLVSGEYTQAMSCFNYVLENFANSGGASYALSHALLCLQYQNLLDSALVLMSNVGLSTINPDLADYATYLSIDLLEKTEQHQIALQFCDSLINNNTTSEEIKKDTLLEKGFVLKYGMDNIALANQVFSLYLANYPDDELAFIAAAELDTAAAQLGGQLEESVQIPHLLPKEFRLSQNYPNPFNASTAIRYDLPEMADITLKIYNIMGQHVTTLVDRKETAGYKRIIWKGTNRYSGELSSGLYIMQLIAEGESGEKFIQAKKMLLIK